MKRNLSKRINKPKLSIITVCRNEALHIRETLDSITAQTFKHYEHIIIDGASTDGTLDIIKRCGSADVLLSERDNGIYNAMNKGIRLSRGEYLLFLNAGDHFYDVDVLAKVFAAPPGEDIVYCDLNLRSRMQNDYGSPVQRFEDIEDRKRSLFSKFLPHPATFIKKKLFETYGEYDEEFSIAGDYEFFIRCLHLPEVTVKHLPVVLTVFYIDGVSNANEKKMEIDGEVKKIRKRYYGIFHYYLYRNIEIAHFAKKKFKETVKSNVQAFDFFRKPRVLKFL